MILNLLVNAIAVYLTAHLLKGVIIKNFWAAILTAIVLAIVNAVVKPIMVFLTIPFTIITFGLFLLVINALMLMLVDAILDGLKIKNFWWALIFGIVLSIVNSILSWIIL